MTFITNLIFTVFAVSGTDITFSINHLESCSTIYANTGILRITCSLTSAEARYACIIGWKSVLLRTFKTHWEWSLCRNDAWQTIRWALYLTCHCCYIYHKSSNTFHTSFKIAAANKTVLFLTRSTNKIRVYLC